MARDADEQIAKENCISFFPLQRGVPAKVPSLERVSLGEKRGLKFVLCYRGGHEEHPAALLSPQNLEEMCPKEI